MSKVINVNGSPRSSCCKAEIEFRKDYTDTHVFVADELELSADGSGEVERVRIQFVRTYDGVDSENVTVECRECGQEIDRDDIDWWEK